MEQLALLDRESVVEATMEGARRVLNEILPDVIRKASTKPYLTKAELIKLTGWSSRKIEYLKSRRQIPFIKRGRSILFPTEDIYDWLEEGRVQAEK